MCGVGLVDGTSVRAGRPVAGGFEFVIEAVKGRAGGLCFVDKCRDIAVHIRCDAHEDAGILQSDHAGFRWCLKAGRIVERQGCGGVSNGALGAYRTRQEKQREGRKNCEGKFIYHK